MEVFIFLSRPDTSNSRVDFSTDGSSRPDRIVTIRRDICSFRGSSTSGSKAYFLFKLHYPTSGESAHQQQLTTRLSSCILDMCVGFGPQLGGFAVPNCVCWKDEYGLQQLKKRDELAEGELCAASAAPCLVIAG